MTKKAIVEKRAQEQQDEIRRLNIVVERELHKRIRIAAAVSEVSVQTLVKEFLVSGLAQLERTFKNGTP